MAARIPGGLASLGDDDEGVCRGQGTSAGRRSLLRGGAALARRPARDFSDFFDHAVKTVDLDGKVDTVLELDGQPSGLGWLPDGRMLVVSMLDRKLLRVEHDGIVAVHADLNGIATFDCNDMVVDAHGPGLRGQLRVRPRHLHARARRRGPVRRARPTAGHAGPGDPDGTASVAAADLKFPNGTVITPDGRTMIVAETLGLRLTAFDIDSDGSLHNRRVWADLGARPPDGICLDADGNVWVAHPLEPVCFLVAEGGGIVAELDTGQPAFACMLGGPHRRHLFILTAATSSPDVAGEGAHRARAAGRGAGAWSRPAVVATLLHLLAEDDWRRLQHTALVYEPPSLAAEGFVHCSPSDAALLEVANLLYANVPGTFVVLSIERGRARRRGALGAALTARPRAAAIGSSPTSTDRSPSPRSSACAGPTATARAGSSASPPTSPNA